MSIPFANFNQTSQMSTSPHDPLLSLASNCVRDFFGPTVQIVADGLFFRGSPCTLSQLLATLRDKCRQKVYSQERVRLLGEKVASRLQNQTLQLEPIKAALLVLVTHSIVKVIVKREKGKLVYRYEMDRKRSRLLPRYPRYVEYAKKALDNMAAALVEELFVQGRMRTVDAILKTVERVKSLEAEAAGEEEEGDDEAAAEDKAKARTESIQAVLDSFKRLTQAGFLEQIPKLDEEDKKENPDLGEFEFEGATEEPPTKKAKIQEPEDNVILEEPEDPTIVNLLKGNLYKNVLPRHAVWRVNVDMFHESLRAFIMGRLVAERYGHKVQSAGSMVTAALKYMGHRRHADKSEDTELTFDAASIIRFIPKSVLQGLEKKRKTQAATTNKSVSVVSQVARSLQQLSSFKAPVCVLEVETGAKPEDSRFEICTTRMVQYLQQRIANQIVRDRHGEVAARVVAILLLNGHLEADSLAEAAMVPAKDIREILHRLYRCKYIDLFTLNQSRTHNPGSMIYLWTASSQRMLQIVVENVCTALLNLRLRRQHQVDIGKHWIERAQEEGDMDENDHEADKLNHRKFCLGLERLYNSCLQLDESLMVIQDF